MLILKNSVVRLVVFAVVFVLALVIVQLSGTTDPLGPGLLLFLVFVLMALVWGFRDGRGAALAAVVVWLLASLAMGIVFTAGTAVVDESVTVDAAEFGSNVLFGLLLILPPALIGIGVGALTARGRSA